MSINLIPRLKADNVEVGVGIEAFTQFLYFHYPAYKDFLKIRKHLSFFMLPSLLYSPESLPEE